MAEHVVDDAKLIDEAAFLATEQRVRCIAPDRREAHRAVLAKLGTELGGGAIRVMANVVHTNAEAADNFVQPRGLPLERLVTRRLPAQRTVYGPVGTA